MNVEYFPYDEQICFMKFGSWTYNGAQVDLKHLDQVRRRAGWEAGKLRNWTRIHLCPLTGAGQQSCAGGHRFNRVLFVGGVGYTRGACHQERGVLPRHLGALLRWVRCEEKEWSRIYLTIAYSRHNIQADHAPENLVLHGKSDSTLCGFDIPHGAGVLLAQRFGREGEPRAGLESMLRQSSIQGFAWGMLRVNSIF